MRSAGRVAAAVGWCPPYHALVPDSGWDLPGLRPSLTVSDGVDYAAVLIPLYFDGHETRVVLTKRPMTMPTHAGHLSFPGGRPDPGDEGPVGTALREAHEEMGIEPASVDVLGFLDPIHTVEFELYVAPVVGRLPENPRFVPSPREVDKVLLPTVSALTDRRNWRSEHWRDREIWFFDIEGEVLWGATAMMVRRLLGLS